MSDAKTPVTNPELVAAIQEARESITAEAWANMVREAARARFITPVDISSAPPGTAESGAREAASFSLHMIEDSSSGQKLYLAFTDREELSRWRAAPGQRVLVLTFDDYVRIVLDGRMESDGFVINPCGGNVVFSRAMLKAMRLEKEERKEPGRTAFKKTTIQLGLPDEPPEALLTAISEYLKTQPGVDAAYLQLMEVEGSSSYLVAIDFTSDKKALFHGISEAVANIPCDRKLDLVSCESEFWRETTRDLEPFYRKEKPE